ncbi:MAG: hypothetical protein P1P74_09460 [Desulfuromonadales bacterium]|nr:hypothetical protein [Desulfuromonadales bacterium]MDT8423524.1 hypothetical protein [Desulfuromonadales bacterium]
MEYIILWAVFPVGSYIVAKDKNRNPYLWAALALLIGPFALLIIALIPNGEGDDQPYL